MTSDQVSIILVENVVQHFARFGRHRGLREHVAGVFVFARVNTSALTPSLSSPFLRNMDSGAHAFQIEFESSGAEEDRDPLRDAR